jgi:hypothetical protein
MRRENVVKENGKIYSAILKTSLRFASSKGRGM